MSENKSNKKRHYARWYSLQRLFNINFLESDVESLGLFDKENLLEINEVDEFDQELADKLVHGVLENTSAIDSLISKLAPERPVKQISKIDLTILRLAIFEGFIDKITPEKVVIDEAIELSKEFGTDTNRKFVSGVLGNLIENKDKYLKSL